MAAVKNQDMDYAIKPEAVSPNISAEEWPLLLKNYDKCTFSWKRKEENMREKKTSSPILNHWLTNVAAQCLFAPATSPLSLLALPLSSVI